MWFYPPPEASLDVWPDRVPEAPRASGRASLALRPASVTNQ